jgi:23S rRNA (cytosine1962-C5)-methyltransferase
MTLRQDDPVSTSVVLHRGKDKAIRNHHHWIYSGAVKFLPDFEAGSILPVRSEDGDLLGHAYFNAHGSIIGRMLSFGSDPPLVALEKNIAEALTLRRSFFDAGTNAFRLINGEGDRVPGLIVDRYDDVLVIQISTLGMERLKPVVLDILVKLSRPRSVYEKSNSPSRREEKLPPKEGLSWGEPVQTIKIMENGFRFEVDIVQSQKTGFYLDQREMRKFVRPLSAGRKVLNAFAYTGGFSVFALAGGALSVDNVDSSERAIASARNNCLLNGFGGDNVRFFAADVFEFIRSQRLDYDLVILDPPAFAKRQSEVVRACRAYKDMHRVVFQKIPPRSLVVTFSCSCFVNEPLFRQVIFQAAAEASREVSVLQRHHQAFDHPLNVFHPESDYLKGFLLYVA